MPDQLHRGELRRRLCARGGRGGTLRCWGGGNYGKLGKGNLESIGDNETPAQVAPIDFGPGSVVIDADIHVAHACAVLDDGAVYCWGHNNFGQLGYGHTQDIGDNELPLSAGPVDVGAPVVDVAVGFTTTCVITDQGAVRCWGRGTYLGYGNTENIGDDELPSSVGDIDLGGQQATALVLGDAHACAILDGGSVQCWGANADGQLGYANTENIGDDELPSAVGPVVIGGAVTQIASLRSHTCVLLESANVRCWGRGLNGRLGYGNLETIGDDETPMTAGDVFLIP